MESRAASGATDLGTPDPTARDLTAPDQQAADPEARSLRTANPEAADHTAANPQATDHTTANPQATDHTTASAEPADRRAADQWAASSKAADQTAVGTRQMPGPTSPPPGAGPTPARLRGMPSRLLTMVAATAQRLVGETLAGEDARTYHYALLAALDEFGSASQAALSERTDIYRSDLVATINELTDRGYVERAADPDDRRRNVITLTTAGSRHLLRLDALLAAVQTEVLAPLSPAERTELTRLLGRLHDHHAQPASTRPTGAPAENDPSAG